jgi:hypothetical protein
VAALVGSGAQAARRGRARRMPGVRAVAHAIGDPRFPPLLDRELPRRP